MCICSPPPPLSFSCFTLLSSRKIHTKKGPGRQVMVTINPLSLLLLLLLLFIIII